MLAPTASAMFIDRLEVLSLLGGTTYLEGAHPDRPTFDVVHVATGTAHLGAQPPRLGAGDIAVLRSAGRVRIDVASGAHLVIVRIPETAAGPHAQAMRGASGRTLRAEQGTSGLVAHLLRGLAAQGDVGTEHPARLSQHVVGLIGLMCLDSRDDDAWRPDILREAIEYIEQHLSDLDLNPDAIAAAQNISTRTLHRLFEREGLTLGTWIRTRRLEQCRAELTDPVLATTAVSAIGARWGLWDAAHFSRLFKSAYGASPRAYRQQVLAERSRTSNQLKSA
ncbi:helix-turn-helix domain-containing protein [Salinibacterium sp. ZJ70]|uniref:helix-turn-helix domain-containing protein n=1 Tax=Salinibacterium sp. ZJ70 TaxID=2708084 RepID=UPI001CD389E0|nr:helix-turn-helix domain-containing protein [Salinibacterium sp. ZJ70]